MDISASGYDDPFPCPGPNRLDGSIVCSSDTCTEEECCTLPPRTCSDTNADNTDQPYSCDYSPNDLNLDGICHGPMCVDRDCCTITPSRLDTYFDSVFTETPDTPVTPPGGSVTPPGGSVTPPGGSVTQETSSGGGTTEQETKISKDNFVVLASLLVIGALTIIYLLIRLIKRSKMLDICRFERRLNTHIHFSFLIS